MVDLYEGFGAIDSETYPTFFVVITFSTDIGYIYKEFGFSTAPNLVVSKPHMAVVSEAERKLYLQSFKWSISYTDGHVTTHKMLEFTNKRTGKEVFYKPTFLTMCKMFFGFIALALIGVFAYTRLSHLWNNWVFWLIASLVNIRSFRLSMLLVSLESYMISFMMFLSPVGTKRLERLSSFLEEIESNMDLKDGSCQYR